MTTEPNEHVEMAMEKLEHIIIHTQLGKWGFSEIRKVLEELHEASKQEGHDEGYAEGFEAGRQSAYENPVAPD